MCTGLLFLFACLSTLWPAVSAAQSQSPAKPAAPPAEPQAKPTKDGTPEPVRAPPPENESFTTRVGRRSSQFTLSYTLSPLGLAIPFKHGPALSWIADENWTFEVAYFKGSLTLSNSYFDVGSFTETLWLLNARYYPGNSFNWIFGISQQAYDAKLGDDLLASLSGVPLSAEVLKTRTLGLQLGFGNRWQWQSGLTIGVDWLVLNIPFSTQESEAQALNYISNETDRQRVEDILKVMRYLPTGAAFKLNLGYSF